RESAKAVRYQCRRWRDRPLSDCSRPGLPLLFSWAGFGRNRAQRAPAPDPRLPSPLFAASLPSARAPAPLYPGEEAYHWAFPVFPPHRRGADDTGLSWHWEASAADGCSLPSPVPAEGVSPRQKAWDRRERDAPVPWGEAYR